MNQCDQERKHTPTVSIGMPVFNAEKYVGGALDSLLAQTFADFELIISDNASTDRTEAICQQYFAKDRRIRYVRQLTNIGAINNFKFVLQTSRSPFFMWAAHDDLWAPSYVEALVSALLTESTLSLAYGCVVLIDKEGHDLGVAGNNYFRSRVLSISPQNPPFVNGLIHCIDPNPYKIYGLYRRQAVDANWLFEFHGSPQHADNLFLISFLSRHKAKEVREARLYYRKIPKSPSDYAETRDYHAPSTARVIGAYIMKYMRSSACQGTVIACFTPVLALLALCGCISKQVIVKLQRVV